MAGRRGNAGNWRSAKDMVGQPPFGRLTVLRRAGSSPKGEALWECQCECGSLHVVPGWELRLGLVTSCGCQREEQLEAYRQTDAARRQWRSLTLHRWPKVCPTCGIDFSGTARQVYCCPACRPAPARKDR